MLNTLVGTPQPFLCPSCPSRFASLAGKNGLLLHQNEEHPESFGQPWRRRTTDED